MTSALFCPVKDCAARGRHSSECNNETCAGCHPRPASDGLLLCALHTQRIAYDALRAAELYDELAFRLTGAGGQNSRVSGTPSSELAFNHAAASARADIQDALTDWACVIASERGIHLPLAMESTPTPDIHCLTCYPRPDRKGNPPPTGPPCPAHRRPETLTALAQFIALHHRWLAARHTANKTSMDLAAVASNAHAAAYPTGARIVPVGSCPQPACGGTVRAILRRTDSLLPSACTCDKDVEHTWTSRQWIRLGRAIRAKATAA